MRYRVFQRKFNRRLRMLNSMMKGIVLLAVIPWTLLVLAACGDSRQERKVQAHKPLAQSAPKKDHCENLHKVIGINDLLLQMHENLGSSCIFQIPPNDLERIWGIKIDAPGRYPVTSIFKLFDGKKFDGSPNSMFYVTRRDNSKYGPSFDVVLTNAYHSKGGEIFPGGKFPSFLKKPAVTEIVVDNVHFHSPLAGQPRARIYPDGDVKAFTRYTWGGGGATRGEAGLSFGVLYRMDHYITSRRGESK